MKKTLCIGFLIFLLVFTTYCGKEENNNVNPQPESPYQQYGLPFQKVPETEDIIMYEINLRAFSPGGDLQGVINRLDEIEELNINVIWLMPIHPIGEINSVNSPYSVKDYKAVGEEYGTLSDLRMLTDEAHTRGIAVIMDWVANHTAWDNHWISNKSWYTQDGEGNIVHPPGTNWQDVADLNYSNFDMRAAMIDAMTYWAYEANIDGFRCDYADGVPFDFWQNAINTIENIPDRKFIFFAEGTRSDHFTAGFDLNFGWGFYSALKNIYEGQSVRELFYSHNQEYNNIPSGKHWIRFTTNHDESAWDATPIRLFNGVNGAMAASVATIFIGGIPLIYSSQEVGTANNVPFFSNSTINWSNNPEMLNAYKDVLEFYTNSNVARTGMNFVFNNNHIACFKKSLQDEELLFIINLRDSAQNFNIPSELQNTYWINVFTNENLELNNELQFQPYEYLILKKQ